MENGFPREDPLPSDSSHRADLDNGQRLYFVPYKWWKYAHDSMELSETHGKRGVLYTATPGSPYAGAMKLINNIFNSDLSFNLRREDDTIQNGENGEVSVSGSEFALVHAEMWIKALKWHSNVKAAKKGVKAFSASEDDMTDVYPLFLRFSVSRESSIFGVKISKKDNASELFKRACKIFTMDSDIRIWDFSGQTNLFSLNDKSKFLKDSQGQLGQEILLELQIYGLSDNFKGREGKKDEAAAQHSNGTYSLMNGGSGNVSSNLFRGASTSFFGRPGEAGSLGLTGLQNLVNTCFMNSAIQCLAHTPKLVDYFLGDYNREINHDNPLGMDGEIALAFGDLIRKLWAPGATSVAPRTFKSKLAQFAPQFSGFNQHDSQELLAFLLDGLHEDLNRVKTKPYVEAKDGEGQPDEEIADEYWRNHLARNDSIIVDVFQGQYKSTLVCPICAKVSVTFDPFMYLSLPLPSTNTRNMTVTVLSTDGSIQPSPYTVSVPKYGKCEDLIQALGLACSLENDETLLVAEVYNNRIIRYLEESTDSLSLIRDGDRLVAYRIKNVNSAPLVIFMHQRMDEQYIHGKLTSSWKAFGIPLVGRVSTILNGSDIHKLYLTLLTPFQRSADGELVGDTSVSTVDHEVIGVKNNDSSHVGRSGTSSEEGTNMSAVSEVEFYLTDEKGTVMESKIEMNDRIPLTGFPKRLCLHVRLPTEQLERYDACLLSTLPEVFKSEFFANRPQEFSLYKCLKAFLKEEPLGLEDMWYCPSCKKHRQASKKLDLWRLPEILVIHLKRFSYTRYMKNKLESYVDFPIEDLDLSPYISYKNGESCYRYMLYAISNHFGTMVGGHYTAFVHHGADEWYDFDDSQVRPISHDKIKSSAAYVLFYRRVVD